MKKRFIIWLSALLITLLPALGSRAEEAAEPVSPVKSDVWVIYVPQIGNNSDQQIAAQYVAKTIRAHWADKKIFWYKVGTTQKNPVEGDYPGDDWFGNIKSVTGAEPYNADGKLVIEAGVPHEIWVLVPAAASENIVRNADWKDNLDSLLKNEDTHIRYIFIGKESKVPEMPQPDQSAGETAEIVETVENQASDQTSAGEQAMGAAAPETQESAAEEAAGSRTALEELAIANPGKVNWIALQDAFTEDSTGENIHTGDYFIASLFGTPVDLPVTTDENGNASFAVPSAGKSILVLQKGVEVGAPVRWDGNDQDANNSFTVSGSGRDPRFGVWYKDNANNNGTYTIGAAEGSIVKAYWYPDLSGNLGARLILNPETDSEGIWNRGSKTVELQIDDNLGKTEEGFTPTFSVLLDGNTADPTKGDIERKTGGDKPDGMSWSFKLDTSDVSNAVSITAALELRANDGNLIWKMPVITREIGVADGELTVKQAEKSETIYVYEGGSKPLTGKWPEYFDYNSNDNPALSIKTPENSGLTWDKQGEDGFTISVSGAPVFGEHQVVLVGTDPKSKEEKTATIKVTVENADDLLKDISIGFSPEGENVNAGGQVKVTVSRNNPEKWNAAVEKVDVFPKWEDLTVKAILNGQDPAELVLNGDKWEKELLIPADAEAGSQSGLTVEVWNGDNKVDIQGAEHSWTILNAGPKYTGNLSENQEIPMGGIPDFVPQFGEYQEVNLLKEAGIQDIWSLFTDDETPDSLVVTVAISPVDGLRKEEPKQEKTDGAAADSTENVDAVPVEETPAEEAEKAGDSTTWTYELTKENPAIPDTIYALKPGEYTITLTASDGVNTSESKAIHLVVKSSVMRILSFVGLGAGILLLAIIALLVIRQARKPKFDQIRIRCLVWSDDSQEWGREMMSKTRPISMANFGKKPVSLNTALMLARQPALTKELAEVAEDIMLLPTKHDELNIVFGKKAMADLGQQDKKISLSQGNAQRIRMGNQYLMIENVQ